MKKSDKKIEKKTKTPKQPKPHEPMSPEKKLALKVILIFAIFGTLLCTLIFAGIYLYKAVCTENSNYILRKVEVISNGFWNGKDRIISDSLKLNMQQDNIFKLDLENIRTKTLRVPGVKHCEIRRILPDTIRISLIERVPRAKIAGHNAYLVDEEGILLYKKYCMTTSQTMPLIVGAPSQSKFEVNRRIPEFINAMQIHLHTLHYYSDIEIAAIDVSDKNFLKFYVRYNKGKLRQAIMPNDLQAVDLRLKALRTALIRSHNANDNTKIYNLSFDGRVVCQ